MASIIKPPAPVESGCVGCNPRIAWAEREMPMMPGFVGLNEFIAMLDAGHHPHFALDGHDINIDFLVMIVPGPKGLVLMNWSPVMWCPCPTITVMAQRRNLFRGNVAITAGKR